MRTRTLRPLLFPMQWRSTPFDQSILPVKALRASGAGRLSRNTFLPTWPWFNRDGEAASVRPQVLKTTHPATSPLFLWSIVYR